MQPTRNMSIGALLIIGCIIVAAASSAYLSMAHETVALASATQATTSTGTCFPTPVPITAGQEPISMEISPLLEAMTDEQLAAGAEVIVIGTVGDAAPARWNTIDGTRPPGIDALNLPNDLMIVADRCIDVDKVVKGTLPSTDLLVRVPGGSVGRDRIIFNGNPEFVAGQRVLLFLTRDDWYGAHIGLEHFTVVGSSQGMFVIEGDQAVRLDRALPLADLHAVIARNE